MKVTELLKLSAAPAVPAAVSKTAAATPGISACRIWYANICPAVGPVKPVLPEAGRAAGERRLPQQGEDLPDGLLELRRMRPAASASRRFRRGRSRTGSGATTAA